MLIDLAMDASVGLDDQRLRDLQRLYVDLLDDEADDGHFTNKVKTMIAKEEDRSDHREKTIDVN